MNLMVRKRKTAVKKNAVSWVKRKLSDKLTNRIDLYSDNFTGSWIL
jgi:hypothetical protein